MIYYSNYTGSLFSPEYPLKIACLTYKVLSTGQPIYMQALFHHYTPQHTLHSVNQHLLPPVNLANDPLVTSHPKTQKSLVLETTFSPTLKTFKCCLKIRLFGQTMTSTTALSHLATAGASDSVCSL